jgi:hypothetical protein
MSPYKQLAGISLVIVAVTAAAQGLSVPKSNPENEELKTRVAELQLRISALEARVDAINKPRMHKAAP